MALANFVEHFMLRYEDRFYKTNVSSKIANYRTEPLLKYGESVTRTKLNMSAVRVRSYTNGSDMTIDALSDAEELMTVNVKIGAAFSLPESDRVQAGPYDPAMEAGADMATKVSNHLDAVVLAETRNAFADFDTGCLTGGVANGTPFIINSTTTPQMVTITKAKLAANNQSMTNVCWVLDPVSIGLIAQYPIGKDITTENTVLKNGFSGNIYGAKIYESNNLTGEAVITTTGNFSNGETFVITAPSGTAITFTAVTTIGTTTGNFLVGGSDAEADLAVLKNFMNDPTTTSATQRALTGDALIAFQDELRIGSSVANGVAVASTATTLTIVAIGSSRLNVTETAANASWSKQMVHAFYGQAGSIDVAVQQKPNVLETQEAKQFTKNYLINHTAAVKTFYDGSQGFLDVLISSAAS